MHYPKIEIFLRNLMVCGEEIVILLCVSGRQAKRYAKGGHKPRSPLNAMKKGVVRR